MQDNIILDYLIDNNKRANVISLRPLRVCSKSTNSKLDIECYSTTGEKITINDIKNNMERYNLIIRESPNYIEAYIPKGAKCTLLGPYQDMYTVIYNDIEAKYEFDYYEDMKLDDIFIIDDK